MKIPGWTLAGFAALLVLAFLALRTPDTDRDQMIAKYGGDAARWAEGEHGLQIHYRDEGDPAGTPLVLIHGSYSSLHTWGGWVDALGGDYRILRLDLPGHALTGAHPRHDYGARAMTAAVDAVVREAGLERFVIAGNSMGGWVAWRYALAHPERLRALILVDAAGLSLPEVDPDPPIGFRIAATPVLRDLAEVVTPRPMIARSLEQSVADPAIVTDEMIDRYWELLRYPGNRAAAMKRMAADREPDMAARIGDIELPTLIIWGAKDRLIPVDHAYAFQDRLPHAELVVFDELGHIPMEEAPAKTAAALRAFLERTVQREKDATSSTSIDHRN